MTTTLPRPHAVGLMPPGHDPRPCVNKPPQWWDLGDEHNARAVRYCRNVCPLADTCDAGITDETRPQSQIRAGRAFNEYGKEITICDDCDHPRTRPGPHQPILCGCAPKQVRTNLVALGQAVKARAERQHTSARRVARDELIERYLPLRVAGFDMKEAAERLGVKHNTLKAAVFRARSAGDTRVPPTRRRPGERGRAA